MIGRLRGAEVLAFVHLLLLALLPVVFRFGGESSAWAALLLYAPRVLWALPLAVLVPLLARERSRGLALTAASAVLIAGPLMSLHPGLSAANGRTALRVLTCNVWFGYRDVEALTREIAAEHPDLVLLQATSHTVTDPLLARPELKGFYFHRVAGLAVASRYPIHEVRVAPSESARLGPPFLHVVIDAPSGPVDVLCVHPHSPRGLFEGLKHPRALLRVGGLDAEPLLFLRAQLNLIAAEARTAGPRLIVAGDFNMPEGSGALERRFPQLRDAFVAAGKGYGFTFPADRALPWMRLDRILLGAAFAPWRAAVVAGSGSDHAAVVADLVEASGP